MTTAPIPDAREHALDLGRFLAASPSSFHAAAEGARRLEAEGFTPVRESEPFPTAPGGYFLRRDGALLAWVQPETG